jgi:hypothetical protein
MLTQAILKVEVRANKLRRDLIAYYPGSKFVICNIVLKGC